MTATLRANSSSSNLVAVQDIPYLSSCELLRHAGAARLQDCVEAVWQRRHHP